MTKPNNHSSSSSSSSAPDHQKQQQQQPLHHHSSEKITTISPPITSRRPPTTIIAVVEYPNGWDGIKKFRIPIDDDNGTTTTTTLSSSYLQRWITNALSLPSPITDNNDDDEINTTIIEIYNDDTRQFHRLSNDDDTTTTTTTTTTTASLLKKRIIRIRVTTPKNNNNNNNEANEPLKMIDGRFFSFDAEGIPFADGLLIIKEISNRGNEGGTGWNVWDGSLLLARYFEKRPEKVRSQRLLELGAGCGLVGIACAILKAHVVVMTDLPHVITHMKSNVEYNKHRFADNSSIGCYTCDWFEQQQRHASSSSCPNHLVNWGFPSLPQQKDCNNDDDDDVKKNMSLLDAILISDCIWVEELVEPLLLTLRRFVHLSNNPNLKVYISYQKRGLTAHTMFWEGLMEFLDVTELNTESDEVGLKTKKDVLFLLECRRKKKTTTNKNVRCRDLYL